MLPGVSPIFIRHLNNDVVSSNVLFLPLSPSVEQKELGARVVVGLGRWKRRRRSSGEGGGGWFELECRIVYELSLLRAFLVTQDLSYVLGGRRTKNACDNNR